MATKSATKTNGTKSTAKATADKTKKTAAPNLKSAVVLFQKSKETKGTFAYKAVNSKGKTLTAEETACPTIYITKTEFSHGPEFIRVTIEEIKALPKGSAAQVDEDEVGDDEE